MKTIFTAALIILSMSIFAQDHIYKTNKDVIECKVTEIGETEVKYTLEDQEVTFVISTRKIEKIILENGKEIIFQEPLKDEENYAGLKTTAWKFGLFSPLTGATNFGYEKMIKPGRSIELNLGVIGLGQNNTGFYQAGGYLKAGYKFTADPSFNLRGITYSHPLMGLYMKPEIAFSAYEQDYQSYYYPNNAPTTGRNTIFSAAAIINIGKQFVFADVMLLDLGFGLGYGFDNMNEKKLGGNSETKVPMNHFSYFLLGETPLAITGGIKIGFLTK